MDLRDPAWTTKNSSKSPIKANPRRGGVNCDYNAFFGEKMAGYYGVPTRRTSRGSCASMNCGPRYVRGVGHRRRHRRLFLPRSIELKPVYDDNFKKVPGKVVESGKRRATRTASGPPLGAPELPEPRSRNRVRTREPVALVRGMPNGARFPYYASISMSSPDSIWTSAGACRSTSFYPLGARARASPTRTPHRRGYRGKETWDD